MNYTVTLTRAEYEALLDRLENAEDKAALDAYHADLAAHGEDAVHADFLDASLVKRLLAGEHPVRI